MAIFESYKNYLLEADDDDDANGDGGQTVDVGPDDNDNAGNQDDQNANQDDNTDNDNGDDNNDNDQNQDNDNTDDGYDVNADDGNDNGGGDTTDDAGTGDTSGDDGSDDEQAPEVENPGLDKIYEKLSPEEKSHHDHELRQHYKKIFRAINILIEKTVALPRTSQTIETTTNLLHTLFAFKKYIIFYIEKKYESKTLIENTIEYWKYTSILSSYKAVYTELKKVLVDKDTAKDD